MLMYDLCLIAAADGGERRVCSTLGELALDSTGLHGMPIYCDNQTVQSRYSFSVVYNNSNKRLLFVSSPFSQSRWTTLQHRAWCLLGICLYPYKWFTVTEHGENKPLFIIHEKQKHIMIISTTFSRPARKEKIKSNCEIKFTSVLKSLLFPFTLVIWDDCAMIHTSFIT